MAPPPPLTILHVDMDAFYASVEVRDNPSLEGLPVCVGGPAASRGVIAAASYEARRFGVHSAMATAVARRMCPDLVLLPPDFDKYTAVSREVMAIFRRYTPTVEPLSLDEAFLDVSGSERLFGDAEQIGRRIKDDILRETSLVASVGVAPTKFLAKLASDLDKPDGFRVIRHGEERAVLDPLPVSKIFGVGPRSAKRLQGMGVRTIGDLASRPRRVVARQFGASAIWIHDLAHGIDPRRVTPRREEKSHGMERTFAEDISDQEELRALLMSFSEEVAFHLRDKGLRGKTVTLKARFSDFKTVTRTKTLAHATNLGPSIYSVASELLNRIDDRPLRLLGVQISRLEDVRQPVQKTLFNGAMAEPSTRKDYLASAEKLAKVTPSLDKLRRKFGRGVVVPAAILDKGVPRGRDGTGAAGQASPEDEVQPGLDGGRVGGPEGHPLED